MIPFDEWHLRNCAIPPSATKDGRPTYQHCCWESAGGVGTWEWHGFGRKGKTCRQVYAEACAKEPAATSHAYTDTYTGRVHDKIADAVLEPVPSPREDAGVRGTFFHLDARHAEAAPLVTDTLLRVCPSCRREVPGYRERCDACPDRPRPIYGLRG